MDFTRHARASSAFSDVASDASSVAGDSARRGGQSYAVVCGRPTETDEARRGAPRPPRGLDADFIGSEERRKMAFGGQWAGLTAYQRHVKLMNDFVLFYGHSMPKAQQEARRTDLDILHQEHRFIRDEDEDAADTSWEKRLARRYYDRLFKEFALADLSNYKTGQVGLRWRTEKEVFSGKGQFICGHKKCDSREQLRSFEVNFAYVEAGEKKNALVKLRLCPDCAFKLNYRKLAELARQEKKAARKAEKAARKAKRKAKRAKRAEGKGGSSSSSSSSSDEEEVEKKGEKTAAKEAMPPPAAREAHAAPPPAAPPSQPAPAEDADVWRGPRRAAEERTAEEECDEYLASMFA